MRGKTVEDREMTETKKSTHENNETDGCEGNKERQRGM